MINKGVLHHDDRFVTNAIKKGWEKSWQEEIASQRRSLVETVWRCFE